MLTLQNDQLTVEILDPRSDRDRLGARYCAGGYIFQITDLQVGPLLSGPTYPTSFNTFDGQGIPDSFALAPISSAQQGHEVVLGVGVCDAADGALLDPAVWDVEEQQKSIVFETRPEHEGGTVDVRRRVSLEGRTVQSRTLVHNAGGGRFRMVWFPHPFFPQLPAGADDLIKISIPVAGATNEAYEMVPSGFIRRLGWPWSGGHYQPLDLLGGGELVITQRHPLLGQVSAACHWTPTYFPCGGIRTRSHGNR